jgi:hypothetical protein
MNVYEEYKQLVLELEKQKVRYAKQDQADIERLENDPDR